MTYRILQLNITLGYLEHSLKISVFGYRYVIAKGMRLSRLSGWKEKQWVQMDLGEKRQERVDKRDAYGVGEMEGGIKGQRQKINRCVCGELG